jgi:hypothetical protein
LNLIPLKYDIKTASVHIRGDLGGVGEPGSDPDAAERAVCDRLALAHEHAEARHILALWRQRRPAAAP